MAFRAARPMHAHPLMCAAESASFRAVLGPESDHSL